MSAKQPRYLSYLLRMWQTRDGSEQTWRASLESSDTRERRGFASLEDLFDFVQAQTKSQDEKTGTMPRKGKMDDREFR